MNAKDVMNELESLNLTTKIYNMYEMYLIKAIENAYDDIDKLIKEAKSSRTN